MKKFKALPVLVLLLAIFAQAAVQARQVRPGKGADGTDFPAWMAGRDFSVDAYDAYEDEKALIEEEGKFQCLSEMKRGNILIKSKGAVVEGAKTLLAADAEEEAEMTLCVDCLKDYGDFKIICVSGREVRTIAENVESGRITFSLKQGENTIRLVGKPAAFRQIKISYLTKDYDKLRLNMF